MDEPSLNERLQELENELGRMRAHRQARRLSLRKGIFAAALIAPLAFTAAAYGDVPHLFSPNTPAQATQVNENFEYLDTRIDTNEAAITANDVDIAAGSVPSGAIFFFASSTCPTGYSAYTAAEGRAIIGLPPGGTVGDGVGAELTNGEDRVHALSASSGDAGGHSHRWSQFNSSEQWRTWNSSGSVFTMMDWGDGMNSDGSGHYPVSHDGTRSSTATYYTDNEAAHSHSVTVDSIQTSDILATLQLLACQKD